VGSVSSFNTTTVTNSRKTF